MVYVYVLNRKGEPLMPTTRYGHVRKLLKSGKATAVNNHPFTIRLKYDTPDIIQSLTLGVDTGRENIGLGVSDENGNCVYLAEIVTNNKAVTKNMQERKVYRNARRRNRRIRKQRKALQNGNTIQNGNDDILRSKKECKSKEIRYPGMEETITCKIIKGKEAKFNNRKRNKDWLTPSARNLVQCHEIAVKRVMEILPIRNIVIERVCFNFQKLENESIENWQYGKGPLYGFASYKDYVKGQQHGRCLLCNNRIAHYHHVKYKSCNGSDNVKNIAGLCNNCHEKVHNDIEYEKKLLQAKEGLRKSHTISLLNSCMDVIIERLNTILPVSVTNGYETSVVRDYLKLDKTHAIDGYIISLCGKDDANVTNMPDTYIIRHFKRKSSNNINSLGKRTYYYDGTIVAVNRHKAFNQKEDSLEEYMKRYAETHTKQECNKHFHELTVSPAKRIYTYHKYGIVPQFKCGDKVRYCKQNKVKGNIKRNVFIVEGVKVLEEKLCYGRTKNSKMKFCSILETKSLQYVRQ